MGRSTPTEMKNAIRLRAATKDDLPIFFEQQLDAGANQMAAFAATDPTDHEAFKAHWDKILTDEAITLRTIEFEGQVAGYILSHGWFGEPEISYWLGKHHWGRGIATRKRWRDY